MQKIRIRFLTTPAALLAAGLFLLVGCGEAENDTTTAATTSTTAADTTAATTAVTTAQAPVADDGTTDYPASAAPLRKSAWGEKLTLPAQPSNGGLYVTHNKATYYRQYNAAGYKKSGLWGYPDEIPRAKKQLMRMDADGSIHKLFEDNGTGGFFMDSKGNFYMQRLLPSEYNDKFEIYSLDAKGNLRWTIQEDIGKVVALDEARGVLVCGGSVVYSTVGRRSFGSSVAVVNLKTGKPLCTTAESEELMCYDRANGLLYFYDIQTGEDLVIVVKRMDIHGKNKKTLAEIRKKQLRDYNSEDTSKTDGLSPENAYISNGKLYVNLISRQGSGAYVYSDILLCINSDGKWKEIETAQRSPASCYGIFAPFTERDEGACWNLKGYYFLCESYDGKAVEVLSQAELDKLGTLGQYGPEELRYYSYRFVSSVDYCGKDIWFTIRDGDYDPEEAIGWRDAYAIKHNAVYRKSGDTGKIELVYEF